MKIEFYNNENGRGSNRRRHAKVNGKAASIKKAEAELYKHPGRFPDKIYKADGYVILEYNTPEQKPSAEHGMLCHCDECMPYPKT